MIGMEEKQLIADLCEAAAEALGRVVKVVDTLERRDIGTVRVLPETCDHIVISGPTVAKAMLALAGRYRRGL